MRLWICQWLDDTNSAFTKMYEVGSEEQAKQELLKLDTTETFRCVDGENTYYVGRWEN